jgi:hypothetical protein
MRKAIGFAAGLLWLSAWTGCEKDTNPFGAGGDGFRYPVRIGNAWKYARTLIQVYRIRPDSTVSDSLPLDSIEVRVAREALIGGSLRTFEFVETVRGPWGISADQTYYSQDENGLFLHAYRNPGVMVPKSGPRRRVTFKGRSFGSVREAAAWIAGRGTGRIPDLDSLIVESPPKTCLLYPLRIGSQWTYRSAESAPWRMDKRVTGRGDVRVPAGNYDCFRIRWLQDVDGNGTWDEDVVFYDDIGAKGLVRRSILVRDMWMTDPENPAASVTFDFQEEDRLVDLNF